MASFTSQIASLIPNVFPAATAGACSSSTFCHGSMRIRCTNCVDFCTIDTCWYCYLDGNCSITV